MLGCIERLSVPIGTETLIFETGRIARQAHGAVVVRQGDSVVISAVCVAPELQLNQDFFPLTVEYRERSSSAGRIPGNYFRREGRPSEREVLVSRMTDRPLRPLFPKGFRNEVQILCTVYSADNRNNPDLLSINGASAALHISKIPFNGPVGAVRVGLMDGKFVINPNMEDMDKSVLDVVVAGTRDTINMVEGQVSEVSEDTLLEALEFGHVSIRQICDAIDDLRARAGLEKMAFEPTAINPDVVRDVEGLARERLEKVLDIREKQARQDAIDALHEEVHQAFLTQYGAELYEGVKGQIKEAFEENVKRAMRHRVFEKGIRIDGRRPEEIRPISIEVGLLPRAHGSALFTRGETQALVSTTLGTSRDEQRRDELTGEEFQRFMLHYNFPPYCVGEVRRMTGVNRREIGHGKLAERALEKNLLLDGDGAFPYTIRVLSDIQESNGSSSMATVCGGTLSLMDAGVPIKGPVAGIAMGLIKEGDKAVILTDIIGAEDHLGDMDFKICGTRQGITAFQMDCKIAGISRALMRQALLQAREGLLYTLDKMAEALPAPRPEISPYAPRIYTIQIPVEKIREVIGPGGKVVRDIQEQSGAEIEIENDGTVSVAATSLESANKALEMIRQITAEPEVGQIYKGTVSRLMGFGAFVLIMGNREGLVHISELSPNHVRDVSDVVKVGDVINVKVVEIDKLGRINLSKVEADRELGLVEEVKPESRYRPRNRFDRDDRDRGPRRPGLRPRAGRERDATRRR